MPLYIDLHIDHNLTPELIRQCHVADKAIQEKYGVRYLQILLNQPQGYLFCLIEGPDKEACARVHAEAHGNIACNILEITERDFGALLSAKNKDSHDFTLNKDGSLDTGFRAILNISLIGTSADFFTAKNMIREELAKHGGNSADGFDDSLVVMFDTSTNAVRAAVSVRDQLALLRLPLEFRVGIDYGLPLQEKGKLFEDSRRFAKRLAFISEKNQITLSSKAAHSYHGSLAELGSAIQVITSPDEQLLNQIMDSAERLWNNDEVNISDFAAEVGISKSQLTRRMNTLMDTSPNDFIRELRMRKAVEMLREQKLNVAEITMALGFNNPSYFSKCFRERFGVSPSGF